MQILELHCCPLKRQVQPCFYVKTLDVVCVCVSVSMGVAPGCPQVFLRPYKADVEKEWVLQLRAMGYPQKRVDVLEDSPDQIEDAILENFRRRDAHLLTEGVYYFITHRFVPLFCTILYVVVAVVFSNRFLVCVWYGIQ